MKENWTYKKLGEIANVSAGQSAPQGDKNYCLDGTPFIKAGNLENLINGKNENEVQKVSDEVALSHRLKKYKKGSVLFAKSGMSCMKGWVYTLKNDCYVVSHLAIVTPKSINSSFLNYYFKVNKPNKLVKDSAYPSISLKDIENFQVPIPSMEEQERIVAELDLLQSVIDKKKAQLDEYDKLAQSIFYEMFGDPIDNPKKWEVKKLGEVCEYAKTRICSNDISINNYVGVDNLLQKCKGKTVATKVPKDLGLTKYVEGDVLVGNIRPYLKKIWLADCCGGCNGDVLAIRRKTQYEKDIETAFLFKYLSTDMFFEFTMQYAKGEKMPRGDKKEIMKYPIPLPPLSLQQSFAEKIEAIEHQKELVKQSLNEVKTLFDSRMDYYFN